MVSWLCPFVPGPTQNIMAGTHGRGGLFASWQTGSDEKEGTWMLRAPSRAHLQCPASH